MVKGRRIIIILWVMLCSISFGVIAKPSIPNPTKEFYVYDEVSVLDVESKNYILGMNELLYRKTGGQIVVAIVSNTQGMDIESYSLELFRKWEIGSKEKNNGVLLIVSLEDKEVRIEVGYGLEGAIPDSKAGRILDDYIIPEFKDSNYKQGIMEGFKAILAIVEEEYKIEIDENINLSQYKLENDVDHEDIRDLAYIFVIMFILIIMDMIFNRCRFIKFLIRMSYYSNSHGSSGHNSNHGRHSGGGGSSGGGGASRKW